MTLFKFSLLVGRSISHVRIFVAVARLTAISIRSQATDVMYFF
jgi:hypothetical protein